MLENRLTNNEKEELATFFRWTEKKSKGPMSFCAEDLLHEGSLKPLLRDIKDRIGAPNALVASSILMKRYAFLGALYLFTLTKFNKQLIIQSDRVFFEDAEKNGMWLPEIRLFPLEVKVVPLTNREKFREEACQHLFQDHISKVIDALNSETKVSKQVLWENATLYLVWMYRTLLEKKVPNLTDWIGNDFRYVTEEADGSIFGDYESNPITPFCQPVVKEDENGEPISIRTTCCYYYMLINNNENAHCTSCPIKCKIREKALKKG